MKTVDRVLVKGEIFLYKGSNISTLFILNDKYNTHVLSNEQIDESYFNDKYLVFECLGNCMAKELYTGKLFHIIYDDEYEDSYFELEGYRSYIPNFGNYNFYKGYKKALDNPLVIYTTTMNRKIYKSDDLVSDIVNGIALQNKKEIEPKLDLIEKQAREKLKTKMNEIIEKDYIEASEINEEYKLKKTI